jgi:hypothetical protein
MSADPGGRPGSSLMIQITLNDTKWSSDATEKGQKTYPL